jgi:rod shape-determining protein MreC
VEDFAYRHRNAAILVVVLVAQFVLLGYQVRRNDDVRLLRVWAVSIFMPIQKLVNGGTGFFGTTWEDYVWLRGAREENEHLKQELDQLKLERQQLRRLLARFGREEDLLAYQKEIPSKTVIASVIAAGANPNAKEVFVNKGSGDGIEPGMAVMTPDGVVGKVQAVFGGASLVLLISDADSAVGVMLLDSREHGVMKGTGKREGRVDYIGNEVELPVGAEIYTSGDDRIYPKGLPVGVVTRVDPGTEFLQVYAKPFVELNQLEEVLIITEGVHQQVPSNYRPQAPTYLMPLPPADPLISGELPPGTPETTEGVGVEGPGQGAAAGAASSAEPATDADRLEQRYRAVGAAQGHVFGEGAPGTKPPNFNLGLTPPAEVQPQKPAQPSRESTPAAGDSVSRATGSQPQGTVQPQANPRAVSPPPPAEAGRAERSPDSAAPAVAR